MGVGGYLFRNNAVCNHYLPAYNTAAVSQVSNSVAGNCGSGTYHSENAFLMWNGSSYNSSTTPKSPNQIG